MVYPLLFPIILRESFHISDIEHRVVMLKKCFCFFKQSLLAIHLGSGVLIDILVPEFGTEFWYRNLKNGGPKAAVFYSYLVIVITAVQSVCNPD